VYRVCRIFYVMQTACVCADIDKSIESATEEAKKQKVLLDEELSRCGELVAETYDRYVL